VLHRGVLRRGVLRREGWSEQGLVLGRTEDLDTR
jgi:hypothetical protein